MSLPVIWSDEARSEFYDAEQWYADIGIALAERFVQAVENTVQIIAESPLQFPVVHRGRRRCPVRRFPYGLFYQVEADRILLIACSTANAIPVSGSAARSDLIWNGSF